MTEQEAILKAKEIYNKDELFIILSKVNADLAFGISIPFIGLVDNKKILFIFDEYEKAKHFAKAHHMELQKEVYPIAKIEKNAVGTSLKAIIDIALCLGICHMEYNSMATDVFGVNLAWFLKVNSLKHESASVIVPTEMINEIKEGKGINMRFNPMKILKFNDPYEITETRKNEILRLVFDAGDTVGDYRNTYNKLSLIECLLLLDNITTRFIPQAKMENQIDHLQYFMEVEPILQEVVWNKTINEKELFTAIDPETNDTLIRKQSVYIFITDKYEKNGKFKYKKIESGTEGIKKLLRDTDAEQIVVTDGPRYLGIIPRDKVIELL